MLRISPMFEALCSKEKELRYLGLLLYFLSLVSIADETDRLEVFEQLMEGNVESVQEHMFKGSVLELGRNIKVVNALGTQDIDEARNLISFIVESQVLSMWNFLQDNHENPWLTNELIVGLNKYKSFYETHGISNVKGLEPTPDRASRLRNIYNQLPLPMKLTENHLSPSEKMMQAVRYLSEQ